MEMINKVIMIIMMSFMVIAAIDRILNQFGGAEAVLSKVNLGALGRSFAGAGSQFEEGFIVLIAKLCYAQAVFGIVENHHVGDDAHASHQITIFYYVAIPTNSSSMMPETWGLISISLRGTAAHRQHAVGDLRHGSRGGPLPSEWPRTTTSIGIILTFLINWCVSSSVLTKCVWIPCCSR